MTLLVGTIGLVLSFGLSIYSLYLNYKQANVLDIQKRQLILLEAIAFDISYMRKELK